MALKSGEKALDDRSYAGLRFLSPNSKGVLRERI